MYHCLNTGASISQLTDPFSLTPTERAPQVEGSQSEEESDDEGRRSFLITSVDIDTGQPSFSHSTDFNSSVQQKQGQFARGQSFSALNTENMSTFHQRSRLRSYSDTNKPGISSSLPRSGQKFSSAVQILDDKTHIGTRDTASDKDTSSGIKPLSWKDYETRKSSEGRTEEPTVSFNVVVIGV